jgi:EthD domain
LVARSDGSPLTDRRGSSHDPEISSVIKLHFCLNRLPHLSRHEFYEYWRDTHAPLVIHHAATLGIRRYVQCHGTDDPVLASANTVRGGHSVPDGVAEIWFDSKEALFSLGAHPAARQASRELLEDERRFIDLPRSTLFYTYEHIIIGEENGRANRTG